MDTPLDVRIAKVDLVDSFPTTYPNRYGGRRYCIFADEKAAGFNSEGEGQWTLEEEKAHLVAENDRLAKVCADVLLNRQQLDRERDQQVVSGSSKECIVVATFASDKWFLLPDNATRWEVTERGLSYSQICEEERVTVAPFHDEDNTLLKPKAIDVYADAKEEKVIRMLLRDVAVKAVSEPQKQGRKSKEEIKTLSADEKRKPNELRGDFGQARAGDLFLMRQRVEDWFFVPCDVENWAIDHRMLMFTDKSGEEIWQDANFTCAFMVDPEDGVGVATIKLPKGTKDNKDFQDLICCKGLIPIFKKPQKRLQLRQSTSDNKDLQYLQDLIRCKFLLPEYSHRKRREMRQCKERSDQGEPYTKIGANGENRLLRIENAALRKEWKTLRGKDNDPGNGNIAVARFDDLMIYEIPPTAETWKIKSANLRTGARVTFQDRNGKSIHAKRIYADGAWGERLEVPSWADVPSVITMVQLQDHAHSER